MRAFKSNTHFTQAKRLTCTLLALAGTSACFFYVHERDSYILPMLPMPAFMLLTAKHPQNRFCWNLDGCLLKIVGSRVLFAFGTSWWLFRKMICTGTFSLTA